MIQQTMISLRHREKSWLGIVDNFLCCKMLIRQKRRNVLLSGFTEGFSGPEFLMWEIQVQVPILPDLEQGLESKIA